MHNKSIFSAAIIFAFVWSTQSYGFERNQIETKGLISKAYSGQTVRIFANGETAVSKGDDEIVLWNLPNRKPIKEINFPEHIRSFDFDEEGQIGIVSLDGSDGSIEILEDIGGKNSVFSINEWHQNIKVIRVSGNGKKALTGSSDGSLKGLDITNREEIFHIQKINPKDKSEVAESMAINYDANIALIGTSKGNLVIIDLTKPELKRAFTRLSKNEERILSMELSGDGKYAVCAFGKTFVILDLKNRKVFQFDKSNGGHSSKVCKIAINGEFAISTSQKSSNNRNEGDTIKIWGVQEQKLLMTIDQPSGDIEGRITALAISPKGIAVLGSDDDDVIEIWDLKNQKLLEKLFVKNGAWDSFGITDDGTYLIFSSSRDGMKFHRIRLPIEAQFSKYVDDYLIDLNFNYLN